MALELAVACVTLRDRAGSSGASRDRDRARCWDLVASKGGAEPRSRYPDWIPFEKKISYTVSYSKRHHIARRDHLLSPSVSSYPITIVISDRHIQYLLSASDAFLVACLARFCRSRSQLEQPTQDVVAWNHLSQLDLRGGRLILIHVHLARSGDLARNLHLASRVRISSLTRSSLCVLPAIHRCLVYPTSLPRHARSSPVT